MVDLKFTAFFEATTLGNFESKTTRDQYVASVRIEAEVRKADVPNDTNFRFGTLVILNYQISSFMFLRYNKGIGASGRWTRD